MRDERSKECMEQRLLFLSYLLKQDDMKTETPPRRSFYKLAERSSVNNNWVKQWTIRIVHETMFMY